MEVSGRVFRLRRGLQMTHTRPFSLLFGTAFVRFTPLMVIFMLTAPLLAKKAEVPIYHYQAYSGPALPPSQTATLDPGELEMTLDGKDLHFTWDGSLREGCKSLKPTRGNTHRFRCRPTRLLIQVIPGEHTIGVVLSAGVGIGFSGPGCQPTSCSFQEVIHVEAGKTYAVKFQGPMGFVTQTPMPMLGVGIYIYDMGAGKYIN